MKKNRDDFSGKTKSIAAMKVNYLCSHPKCRSLTISGKPKDVLEISNNGVAAHICAAAKGGKRYDPLMTETERASIENCIWLCQSHAHLIDTDETKYTVALLKEWKSQTEQFVMDQVEISLRIASIDVEILEGWYEKFRIDCWEVITGELLQPALLLMRSGVVDDLTAAGIWLSKKIHLIKNNDCRFHLSNFASILKKLIEVFMLHIEMVGVNYKVAPYRHNGYDYKNVEEYNLHCHTIWELTFELTKSINAICEIVRNDYCCTFANDKVCLVYTTDILEGHYTVIVEYGKDEKIEFDYNEFLKNPEKRIR